MSTNLGHKLKPGHGFIPGSLPLLAKCRPIVGPASPKICSTYYVSVFLSSVTPWFTFLIMYMGCIFLGCTHLWARPSWFTWLIVCMSCVTVVHTSELGPHDVLYILCLWAVFLLCKLMSSGSMWFTLLIMCMGCVFILHTSELAPWVTLRLYGLCFGCTHLWARPPWFNLLIMCMGCVSVELGSPWFTLLIMCMGCVSVAHTSELAPPPPISLFTYYVYGLCFCFTHLWAGAPISYLLLIMHMSCVSVVHTSELGSLRT